MDSKDLGRDLAAHMSQDGTLKLQQTTNIEHQHGQIRISIEMDAQQAYDLLCWLHDHRAMLSQAVEAPALYGPTTIQSDYQPGQIITYTDKQETRSGEIIYVCAPSKVVEGRPMLPLRYIVDTGSGFPDTVYPQQIVERNPIAGKEE